MTTVPRIDSRSALLCHELLHKLNAPNRFNLADRLLDDPLPKALKEAGIRYEKAVLQELAATSLRIFNVPIGMGDSVREAETAFALISHDYDLIVGASFGEHIEPALRKLGHSDFSGEPGRVSRPDLLVRMGTGENGLPLWAPVDIKSHEAVEENKSNLVVITKLPSIDPESATSVSGRLVKKDGMQLAHYMRHLQNLGLAPNTPWGGILGRDSSFIAWADLNALTYGVGQARSGVLTEYDLAAAEAVRVIDASIARNGDETLPPVTIARRISSEFGCPSCEMRKVCRKDLEQYDNNSGHVTLLADVTAGKADKYFPGIESIRELIKATGLPPQGLKAQIRAEVWVSKVPRLVDPSEPLAIPEFDIEIDIDLENSQEALREAELETIGRDSVYLYGYGIHDRTKDQDWRRAQFGYFDDYSDTDEAEFSVLSQMWNFIKDQIAKAEAEGKSIGIFHYSPHERTWWRNYAERHASKPGSPFIEEIDHYINNYFVDLYPLAQRVALPVTGYSIKVLAPHAGFNWDVSDAGGGNSIVYYQTATSSTASKEAKEAAIKWLREYNRDDVKATFAVREYLRTLNL